MPVRTIFATMAFIFSFIVLAEESFSQPPGNPKIPGVVIEADRFDSIQAALDAVPVTGGRVVLPAKTIEIQTPLIIRTERTRLTGAGAATHLVNKNEQGLPLIHVRADGYAKNSKLRLWQVQLDNFQISGNPKSGSGILAQGIQEIFIQGVSVHHHGRHGVFLDHCYEDPRVSDCLITYNKQAGLNLLGNHDIVVNGNHFEENGDAVRCLDGFNLTMNGNNLDDHLGNGIVIENTYGSVVSGNMIEECNGWAIILDRDCYGITLSSNVIAHDMKGGIDLRDAWGCTVCANTFTLVHHAAVQVHSKSGRINISANTFCNSDIGGAIKRKMKHDNPLQLDAGSGIVLDKTTDILISGNMFSGLDGSAVICKSRQCERIHIVANLVTDFGRRNQKGTEAFDVPKTDSIQIRNNMIGPAKLERPELKK